MTEFTSVFIALIFLMAVVAAVFLVLFFGVYLVVAFYRHRDREKSSLSMVCLQVAVPRDNEIKTDAMEQVFNSLSSIKKGGLGPFGWFSFLQSQPHISFEIVASKEDIRFYIVVPDKLRDLVEKQIHGSYPGAEIKIVEEPNIFTEEGVVEYKWLVMKGVPYKPLQVYKNLAVDPMAALTSSLAKMGEGEGAHIQIIIAPADSKWKSQGRSWIGKTKKSESDPEKASYKVDPKVLEAVDNKVSKNGYETTIRLVVCSTSKESAKAHMGNIRAAFEQYNGDNNGLTGKNVRFSGTFVSDFI